MGLSLSLSTCFPTALQKPANGSLSHHNLFPPTALQKPANGSLSLSLCNLSLHCFAETSKWDSLSRHNLFSPTALQKPANGILYHSLSTTSFPPLLCRSQQMGLLSLSPPLSPHCFAEASKCPSLSLTTTSPPPPPHCFAEASKWDSLTLSPQPLPSTAFQQPAIAPLR